MAVITKNFHHKGKWYFPGDNVDGKVAEEAAKHGCIQGFPVASKSLNAAPENKSIEEIEDGCNDD